MPKKRGFSTPNTSFSPGNPHNPILANPLSFGNFPGSQPVVELHRQSFVLELLWSFSQTSCLWSWCFSHPSLVDSCKICHLFFEADQPSLWPSCAAWLWFGFPFRCYVAKLNRTSRAWAGLREARGTNSHEEHIGKVPFLMNPPAWSRITSTTSTADILWSSCYIVRCWTSTEFRWQEQKDPILKMENDILMREGKWGIF